MLPGWKQVGSMNWSVENGMISEKVPANNADAQFNGLKDLVGNRAKHVMARLYFIENMMSDSSMARHKPTKQCQLDEHQLSQPGSATDQPLLQHVQLRPAYANDGSQRNCQV